MQMQQECLCCRAHVRLNGFMTQCGYVNRQQWYSSPGHIIPLTGNVLAHCHSNKRDYSIKMYAIKRAIKAKSNTFGFWFSTFYSNKRVMQLSDMRLSGLYCSSLVVDTINCQTCASCSKKLTEGVMFVCPKTTTRLVLFANF